jgi:ABC-type bacteriocin/lantibiotic exporter with double-glycine peptidase domain
MQFQQLGSYVDRIDDVLATPREQSRDEVVPAPRLQGSIELEEVSFAYTPASAPTIQQVSVRIQPGQLVGIVGPSGAGKTTLANLMLGLLRPSQGRILFDGTDLNTLEARSVRSQLGVVVQDTHLFGATIREAIALGDPSLPLDAIEQAARLAHIHDDIVAMPMGYNTLIGDMGAALSGGQKQRILLARALYKRPRILFLDEATSALDVQKEKAVNEAIRSLKLTRIIIAHRPETIASAERVIVLQGGKVAQDLRRVPAAEGRAV